MIETTTRNPQAYVECITSKQHRYNLLPVGRLNEHLVELATSRSIGQPAGSFQMTLLPRPLGPEYAGLTWHDLIHPMDCIVIMAQVPPRPPRTLMVGFVDTVVEQGSLAGGHPSRSVVVAGRDYGKLALNTKIYLLDLKGDAVVRDTQELRLFLQWQAGHQALSNERRYAKGAIRSSEQTTLTGPAAPDPPNTWLVPFEPKPFYTPKEVMQVIWCQFFRPQFDLLRREYDGAIPDADVVFELPTLTTETGLSTLSPQFSPALWRPYSDVWSLMRAYQHAPWFELFWREDVKGRPELVLRGTPWLDFEGNTILPGIIPRAHAIDRDSIINWAFTRSDEQVQNFFFTHPPLAAELTHFLRQEGVPLEALFNAGRIFSSNPFLVGLGATGGDTASTFQRFGVRLAEVSTPYMDYRLLESREEVTARVALLRRTSAAWNAYLVKAYDHGSLLEAGTVLLKGDERLQLGHYVQWEGDRSVAYIEGLSHRFRYGTGVGDGHFLTSLRVTRGRGHMLRTQTTTNPGTVTVEP